MCSCSRLGWNAGASKQLQDENCERNYQLMAQLRVPRVENPQGKANSPMVQKTSMRKVLVTTAGFFLAFITAECSTRSFYNIRFSSDPSFGVIYAPGSIIRSSSEGHGAS